MDKKWWIRDVGRNLYYADDFHADSTLYRTNELKLQKMIYKRIQHLHVFLKFLHILFLRNLCPLSPMRIHLRRIKLIISNPKLYSFFILHSLQKLQNFIYIWSPSLSRLTSQHLIIFRLKMNFFGHYQLLKKIRVGVELEFV